MRGVRVRPLDLDLVSDAPLWTRAQRGVTGQGDAERAMTYPRSNLRAVTVANSDYSDGGVDLRSVEVALRFDGREEMLSLRVPPHLVGSETTDNLNAELVALFEPLLHDLDGTEAGAAAHRR